MRASTRLKLETWIVVTVLAGLVWLLAEGRTVNEFSTTMQVQLAPPPGQPTHIEPSSPIPVEIYYRGAAEQKAQIESMPQPIRLEVRPDPQSPRQVVILRERLLTDTAIGAMGVTLLRVTPATVDARVEPLVDVPVPVVVDPGELQLAEPPTVAPAEINVTVPARLANQARQARLTADLAALELGSLDENVAYTRRVPLQLPATLRNPLVQVPTGSIDVTFKVRSQNARLTLPSVPVLMLAPPTELTRFNIIVSDEQRVLRDVALVGPRDVIERIRQGELEIYAQFRLTADDLESQVTSAPLRVSVPPDVRVESSLPRVSVTIEKTQ